MPNELVQAHLCGETLRGIGEYLTPFSILSRREELFFDFILICDKLVLRL